MYSAQEHDDFLPFLWTERSFCSVQVEGESKVKLKQLQQIIRWGLWGRVGILPSSTSLAWRANFSGPLWQKYSIFQLTGKKQQCLFPEVVGLLYPHHTAQPVLTTPGFSTEQDQPSDPLVTEGETKNHQTPGVAQLVLQCFYYCIY